MVQDNDQQFRKIFIVEASHDLAMAKRYTKRISLLTDGGEKMSELKDKIANSLEDFDFEQDAIIPMGRVVSCFLAGMVLMSKLPIGKNISVGVYRGDCYEFEEIGKNA